MVKSKKMEVIGREITFSNKKTDDYISRTSSAIECCGLWEQMNKPDFKRIEFDAFRSDSGSNSFALTPKDGLKLPIPLELFPNQAVMVALSLMGITQMTSLVNNATLKKL